MRTLLRPLYVMVRFALLAILLTGSAFADQLSYVPLSQPCRLLDSRLSTGGPGPLTAAHGNYLFGTSALDISGSAQHGSSVGCGIPSGIEAISVNMNMLNTTAAGNIATWNPDGGTTVPNIGTGVYNPTVVSPVAGEVAFNTGYTTIPVGGISGSNPGRFYLKVANGQIDMTINIVGFWVPDFFSLPYATTQSYSGTLFSITNSGAGAGIAASSNGGTAAFFTNSNSSNTANTLQVTSNGQGVIADHSQGNAGNFFMNNTSGVGAGVRGEVNSIFGNNGTAGVYGTSSGTGGYGGYFEHSNASGFGMALYAVTAGQGVAAHFETSPTSNTQPTVQIVQNGTGESLDVASTNNTNTTNIVNITANGPGVIADHSQGNVGNFFMNNTSGVGAGVRGEVNSIFGNNGTAGVYGVASGTGGYAGYFEHSETTGFGITLQVITYDQGTAMVVDHEGSGGNIAIFQSSGLNKARIDKNGKGYFDGGTQNSGADLAEFIPVGDAVLQPGDVVEIDPTTPDSFRLATEAYSTRVAGVISTKPGVALNAENGAQAAAEGPALALAGRVPVKASNINGAIHIGDLLVASSIPGYAMRADTSIVPGAVIGKALANFDAHSGTLPMLVWMH